MSFFGRFRRKNAEAAPDREGGVALSYLRAPSLAQAARADIARARYPDDSPEFAEAHESLARQEVKAAATLPIDAQGSRADKLLTGELERAESRLRGERGAQDALVEQERAAGQARAKLPAPSGRAERVVRVVGQLLVSAAFAGAAALLFAITIDAYVARPYLTPVYGAGAARLSFGFAVAISATLALALHVGQSLAVVHARGKLSWAVKSLVFLGDIMLSASLGAFRLGQGNWRMACAFTLIELGLLVVHTALLLGFAKWCREDSALRVVYDPAAATVRALSRQRKDSRKRVEALRRELDALFKPVALREEGVRRMPLHGDLAALSARVEYLSSTSDLVAREAANPSADAMAAAVDRHVAALLGEAMPKGSS
jgi:hypothetical protein